MKASWWLTALLLTAGAPRQESGAPAPGAAVSEVPGRPDDEALAGG